MRPVLRTGDIVELHPVGRDSVRRGDVITFSAEDGRKIIHRVVRESPLQTRGDNCGKDDPPVPENAELFHARAFRRNGRTVPLSAGPAGMREFRRNQFLHGILTAARRIASAIAAGNVFRIPFRRLNKSVFTGKTIYYAGKYPVGWLDAKGWHWMRFARYFVESPPEDLHE